MSLDPTLRFLYDFKNQHNLQSRFGLGPDVVHTRAQDGYSSYYESTGVMRFATVDQPRFDHDPLTGEPLGILHEPARRNRCVRATDFSTVWTALAAVYERTDNAGLSPDGKNELAKFQVDTAGGTTSNFGVFQSITVAAGDVTKSIHAKPDQTDWIAIRSVNYDVGVNGFTYFNVRTGVIGTVAAGITAKIHKAKHGLYRCVASFNTVATAGQFRIYIAAGDGDVSITRDGKTSVFLWGGQSEDGDFVTSLIPTVATVQDRGDDLYQVLNVSAYINHGTTIYCRASLLDDYVVNQGLWSLDDGVGSRTSEAIMGGTNTLVAFGSGGMSVQTANDAIPDNTIVQVAHRIAVNSCAMYVDGVASTPDNLVASVPIPTALNIGSRFDDSVPWAGHIEEFRLYVEGKIDGDLSELSLGNTPYGFPDLVASSKAMPNGVNAAAIPRGTFISGM